MTLLWCLEYVFVLKPNFWYFWDIKLEVRLKTGGFLPGAPDVTWAGGLDLGTNPSQHVAVVLRPELHRTHNSFTLHLLNKKQRISAPSVSLRVLQSPTFRSAYSASWYWYAGFTDTCPQVKLPSYLETEEIKGKLHVLYKMRKYRTWCNVMSM